MFTILPLCLPDCFPYLTFTLHLAARRATRAAQVRSGLLAALEALPPYALFGLVTFSNRIGLHDVRAPAPAVRYVPIREGPAASSLATALSGACTRMSSPTPHIKLTVLPWRS